MINLRRVDGNGPSILQEPTAEPTVVPPPPAVQPQPTGFISTSTYQPPPQAPVELTPAQENAQDAALAKLSPEQQVQFNQALTALNGNAEAQTDLRQELLNGKLTGPKDANGQTLLDHLSTLADTTAPLKGNLDRGQLMGDLLKETAHPSSINQGNGNFFCGATAVSYSLASKNPAEYGRLITGLATDGDVTLQGRPNGQQMTLTLPPGFAGDDGSGRSLTQQLLAQPLTQAAAGPQETVDHQGVGHVHNTIQVGQTQSGQGVYVGPNNTEKGTFGDQVARMQSAVHGEDYRSASIPRPGDKDYASGYDKAKQTIRDQAAHGANPAIERGHHWFAVTKVDDKDNVSYVDEHGHQCTCSMDDFLKGADSFTYNAKYSSTPAALADDGHGGPGGGWNPSSGSNTPGTYTGGG